MSVPPFVDPESGALDLAQIRTEVFPLAGLILLFGAAALLLFLIGLLVGGGGPLTGVFTVASQFVLAVGAGVLSLYVVARGIQLADE